MISISSRLWNGWKKFGKVQKEETTFNCWCNTGLIATSNSAFNNSQLEASSEVKEIKIYLLNLIPVQFHSTIKELLILDE